MRGAPTRRARRQNITPSGLMLVVFGFMALTFIVLLPAKAGAAYLDGAGTASLQNSPVEPEAPAPDSGASGSAVSSGGGLGVPGLPEISRVICLRQCVSSSRATRGAIIAIRGENLDRVIRVIFRGKRGWLRAKYRTRSKAAVRVTVPRQAIRGYLA
ncbi:MAG TPA: hypothetical protein PLJ64_12665, partial [Solirubrobacterales bacterium]|nr:hypothetical protein [Solirubrobacterales bacterium]